MKQSIRNFFAGLQYAKSPFGHWLMPLQFLLLGLAFSQLGIRIALPESLNEYEIFFMIFAIFFFGLFLLSGLPCGVYSMVLSVRNMIREKRYVLPILQFLLDGLLLCLWYMTATKFL